jgi:hypothetical protein
VSAVSVTRGALLGAALLLAACGGYGTAMPPGMTGAGAAGAQGGADAAAGATSMLPEPTATPSFQPRAEFAGPCERASNAVDVNLGNSPEAFVRAATCQVTGAEPTAEAVTRLAGLLRTDDHTRRIDVVRQICRDANRGCSLMYSDPWQADIPLAPVCTRKTKRDLGAVLMFFSNCPGGVNCGMDWANTHAHGMAAAHPIYGFGAAAVNYYNPRNAGYWYRQLLDARWAGLQFFVINTYGPDITGTPDQLAMLSQALDAAGPDGTKVALFDDPWAWGQSSSPAQFKTRPNMSDTEAAAQAIYQAKWKPFYTRIAPKYWYRFKDRPFIYFYNAGTLQPLNVSAAVVARLKQLFAQDFGVTPFVAVDTAYFSDPAMPGVADSEFRWSTLGGDPRGASATTSRSTRSGVTLEHFMVKWDSLGRDRPGAIAASTDKLIKGTSILADRLTGSADADIAVIATWNDLGEGTGIERNYDYYLAGAWAPPTVFMSVTRGAQCSD